MKNQLLYRFLGLLGWKTLEEREFLSCYSPCGLFVKMSQNDDARLFACYDGEEGSWLAGHHDDFLKIALYFVTDWGVIRGFWDESETSFCLLVYQRPGWYLGRLVQENEIVGAGKAVYDGGLDMDIFLDYIKEKEDFRWNQDKPSFGLASVWADTLFWACPTICISKDIECLLDRLGLCLQQLSQEKWLSEHNRQWLVNNPIIFPKLACWHKGETSEQTPGNLPETLFDKLSLAARENIVTKHYLSLREAWKDLLFALIADSQVK